MDYNPYAAPGGQAPLVGPEARRGQPQPWNTAEVVARAWKLFKDYSGVLVAACLIEMFVSGVVGQVSTVLTLAGVAPKESWALQGVGAVLGWPVAAFFQVGQTRIWLAAARGEPPRLGMLFSGADRFLPLLGLQFLSGLAIGGGLLLLVVPGVIVALGLFVAQFYVVDKAMGPIEGMKASWSATRGYKGEIVVLWLAGCGLALLGAAACCVGMFVTLPVFLVAQAIVFTRISGLGESAPAPT